MAQPKGVQPLPILSFNQDPKAIQELLLPTVDAGSRRDHVRQALSRILSSTSTSVPVEAHHLPTSHELKLRLEQTRSVQEVLESKASERKQVLRRLLSQRLEEVRKVAEDLEGFGKGVAELEDEMLLLCQGFRTPLSVPPSGGDHRDALVKGGGQEEKAQALLGMDRLKGLNESLERFRLAKAYFEVISRAEQLGLEVLERISSEERKGGESGLGGGPSELDSLTQLCRMVGQSESMEDDDRGRGEGSLPNLNASRFLRSQRDSAFVSIRDSRVKHLKEELARIGWPDSNHGKGRGSPRQPKGQLSGYEGVKLAWIRLCQLQDKAEELGLIPRASAKGGRSQDLDAPHLDLDPVEEGQGQGGENASSSPANRFDEDRDELPGSEAYVPLMAVQVLVEPLLLRFRYHFDGDRSTNRLDKPEWYLSHISSLILSQSNLFRPSLQGVKGSGGEVSKLFRLYSKTAPPHPNKLEYRHVDTYSELLHSLLLPLKRKLRSSIPSLLPHPPLLAHTIFQTLTFDEELREKFAPCLTVRGGRGCIRLADQVLMNRLWFTSWLKGEKEFSKRSFDEVLNSSRAWTIGSKDSMAEDDENEQLSVKRKIDRELEEMMVASSETSASARMIPAFARPSPPLSKRMVKTTLSARKLVEILESITERYRPLPDTHQKVRFITKVQKPLLDQYHKRLRKGLEFFETSRGGRNFKSIPGDIPGNAGGAGYPGSNDKDRQVTSSSASSTGLVGLGGLLKILLSALHIREEVEGWSESAFFIEISEEVGKGLAGPVGEPVKGKKDLEEHEGKGRAEGVQVGSEGNGKKHDDWRQAENDDEDVDEEEPESDSDFDRELDNASLGDLLRRGFKRGGVEGRGSHVTGGRWGLSTSHEVGKGESLGIWDEVLAKYQGLVNRSIECIERFIIHEVLEPMRSYSNRRWDLSLPSSSRESGEENGEGHEDGRAGEEDDEEDIPTPSLIPCLYQFSNLVSQVVLLLEPTLAIPIYRRVSRGISLAVVERVIMAGGSRRFDRKGCLRFKKDVENGWLGVAREISSSNPPSTALGMVAPGSEVAKVKGPLGRNPEKGFKILTDVATLLCLPISDDKGTGTGATAGREGFHNLHPYKGWNLDKAVRVLKLVERLGENERNRNPRAKGAGEEKEEIQRFLTDLDIEHSWDTTGSRCDLRMDFNLREVVRRKVEFP